MVAAMINIQVIPHSQQRYETVGDWWKDEQGILQIRVSEFDDWKMESAVAVHELIEIILCHARGIKQDIVDDFDKNFEANRQEGNTDEPGDDPKAPYRKEHFFATSIERLLCAELDINWKEYEEKINN